MWLGEERKCSATVVGLALMIGLSMVRLCSLNQAFNRQFLLCTVNYGGYIESCSR